MPKRTRVGEQWDICDRCGILTPLSRLKMDYELKLCDRYGCRDKIDREIHLRTISKILSAPTREMEDRRGDIYFKPQDYDEIL